MNERQTVLMGTLVGALAGAAAGFLLFTERGRQLRRDLEPELDGLVREALRLRDAVEQVREGIADLASRAGER